MPTQSSLVEMQPTRKAAKIALALAGVLILSHCAQRLPESGAGVGARSTPQELQRLERAHEEVLAHYGVVENPALQDFVTRVGRALARSSRRPDLDWHFTVLDSSEVNAFALSGGYVYVTRGMLAYLATEAELAAVLGHEIGHLTARHAMQPQLEIAATSPADDLGSALLQALNRDSSAARPKLSVASWVAGYGREQELEADRLGAEDLARAGYDPEAMLGLIDMLNDQERFEVEQAKREGRNPRHYHASLNRRAEDEARLKQVVAAASRQMVVHPKEDSDRLLRVLDGITFGDQAEQGVIHHNALLHEKLGIALQFPQGWQVQIRADRVGAVNSQGDAMMALVPGPRHNQPMETLQEVLKLDPGARYESGTVSGEPAAFVAGARQGKPLLVAAIDLHGRQYLIAGMTRDASAYQRNKEAIKAAINSFHPITAAERQQARPYVISVIEAQSGTRMAELAAGSPLGPEAERYLRLMNRLYPNGEPRPGQLLKVVN